MKYFHISIQHGYYLIKHPFTKRPCLPCFELARLLNKDENYISHLVSQIEISFSYLNFNKIFFLFLF